MSPYNVVVADCPWTFGDSLPGKSRGAIKQYDCMPFEDICKLELPPIADDALLFLWRVSAMQEEALAVMHMWGFDLKSEIVWVKTKIDHEYDDIQNEDECAFGMGRYVRHCHETCLIGVRGKGLQLIKDHGVRSVFAAPKLRHSQKPERFFELVEKLTGGEGSYLELFARRNRPGWTCLGAELGTPLTIGGNSVASRSIEDESPSLSIGN